MDYYVYIYWRLDTNEPFYVGKGHRRRWRVLNRKYNKHFMNIINNTPIAVTIEKENLTEDESFYWEEEVIRQLVFEYGFSINIINNTSYDNYCHLVNMTWGGDGSSGKNSYYDKTEEEMNEIKRKISESKKGKKRSEETIRRISKNHANMKGENNPMYGKKGKDAPSSKTVICLTTNRIFLSAKSGGIFYDCDPSTIIKCCRGVKKSCGKLSDGTKLVWRYLTIIEL